MPEPTARQERQAVSDLYLQLTPILAPHNVRIVLATLGLILTQVSRQMSKEHADSYLTVLKKQFDAARADDEQQGAPNDQAPPH